MSGGADRFVAVVGAQFGDEGKGVMTDFLSSPDALVVRYNGGSQAGHTVVTPDGARHVFKHIGAGTFRGASTLLSRFFIVNPLTFVRERVELPDEAWRSRVRLFVDPRCIVTTPFDMMLNQWAETARGEHRHGSCGVGINETVERSRRAPAHLSLTVGDLDHPGLLGRINEIAAEWVPARAAELGVTPSTDIYETWASRFVDAAVHFLNAVTVVEDRSAIARAPRVVFEGAQGLRLDEYASGFPHVTRSRTGLPNVAALMDGIADPVTVYYVTRSYVTRHGAGPLTDELPGHPSGWVGPETNEFNQFQQYFRYARLSTTDLANEILFDQASVRGRLRTRPGLVVTCLDQHQVDAEQVAADCCLPLFATSSGPTRADVAVLEGAAAHG